MKIERGSQERFGKAAVLCEAVLYVLCRQGTQSSHDPRDTNKAIVPLKQPYSAGIVRDIFCMVPGQVPGQVSKSLMSIALAEQYHWMAEVAQRLKDMVLNCGPLIEDILVVLLVVPGNRSLDPER